MFNLTAVPSHLFAIALMIELHGLFAAVVAIALIGVSVLVALVLLISGVFVQKKKGLSFTQQKRFGYFLGAWVCSLCSGLIIMMVDNPELCQGVGTFLLRASNPHTGCYELRWGLDQYSVLWGFAIVVSGILAGAFWPRVKRFLCQEHSQ